MATPSVADKFRSYHKRHPDVWREFARRALSLIRQGFRHYSARAIIHHLRWHSRIDGRDPLLGDPYKIPNSYSPFYARMFIARYPEHRRFFLTIPSEADKREAGREVVPGQQYIFDGGNG